MIAWAYPENNKEIYTATVKVSDKEQLQYIDNPGWVFVGHSNPPIMVDFSTQCSFRQVIERAEKQCPNISYIKILGAIVPYNNGTKFMTIVKNYCWIEELLDQYEPHITTENILKILNNYPANLIQYFPTLFDYFKVDSSYSHQLEVFRDVCENLPKKTNKIYHLSRQYNVAYVFVESGGVLVFSYDS